MLRVIRVLWRIVVLLSAQEDPRNQGERRSHHNDQAAGQGDESRPLIVQLPQSFLDEYAAKKKADDAAEAERGRIDRHRFWVEFIALVILVVGTAGMVITLILLRQSTDATREASQQAKVANDLARELSERSERPWIGLNQVVVAGGFGFDDKLVQIQLEFINSGKSPAFQVDGTIIVDAIETPPEGPLEGRDTPPMLPKGIIPAANSIVFPNQIVRIPIVEDVSRMSKKDFAKLQTHYIVYWGKVTYRDRMGTIHTTAVCGYTDPNYGGLPRNCAKGNSAD